MSQFVTTKRLLKSINEPMYTLFYNNITWLCVYSFVNNVIRARTSDALRNGAVNCISFIHSFSNVTWKIQMNYDKKGYLSGFIWMSSCFYEFSNQSFKKKGSMLSHNAFKLSQIKKICQMMNQKWFFFILVAILYPIFKSYVRP